MEFDINSFIKELRTQMSARFPYENETVNQKKHSNRLGHIREVAFQKNPTIYIDENHQYFDIGNYMAEKDYPYYHILQDAPVIRKRNRSTDKLRGSQAKVKDRGNRDYGKISFNGKTYTKEYAKNVRGKRKSVIDNSTQRYGNVVINRESNTYKNIHYQYIDKMLDNIIPILAPMFGGRLISSRNTSLEDDYNESKMIENMLSSYKN